MLEHNTLPEDSLCRRNIISSSTASNRHVLIFDSCRVHAESSGEANAILLFAAMPGVAAIREQYPTVQYKDSAGRTREHTFDLCVDFDTGVTLAIAVKSNEIAEQIGFAEQLHRIAAYVPEAIADAALLLTDVDIPVAQRRLNAAVVGAHRDYLCGEPWVTEADALAWQFASRLQSSLTLEEFSQALGLPQGRGFRAGLRAIKAGHLEVVCTSLRIGRTRVQKPG
ncbi:MAG: TnsA endonuclease N-terminal domain-containing protein [Novosphingobium sp.]|nr:TnsA endonuclease N-terminal domain-containing protein [Novosphingobium sp.]